MGTIAEIKSLTQCGGGVQEAGTGELLEVQTQLEQRSVSSKLTWALRVKACLENQTNQA